MSPTLVFKILIVLLLLAVLVSLTTGLRSLIKDDSSSKSTRTVKSLTVRIALSLALFVLLFIGYKFNLIQPHDIYPAVVVDDQHN